MQRACWRAYLAGKSGLVHAPTGLGKTYAAWFGPILEALATAEPVGKPPPLHHLWITPLRALANDTLESLRRPVEDLGLGWSLELRHGDLPARERARQKSRLPTVLVTTPESLTLLLSQPDCPEKLRTVRSVVVDEWHELLGSKRGVQTELALARLRTLAPGLRVWGLSATLGNLQEAMAVLLGPEEEGLLVEDLTPKKIEIHTLIPDRIERFAWSGHLGLPLLPQVLQMIEKVQCTLIFTNTRAQTERWFQAIFEARPDWAGRVALHHGSLDRKIRTQVEGLLDSGRLRAVVCTSSLDLGVDFAPVDQVIQIGSPKGIARLRQRAGRSGHRPGAISRIVGLPASALELAEYAAAREALARGEIEARRPLRVPLDVLLQHLVTVALGGGFTAEDMLAEVRRTYSFQQLSRHEWEWCLGFLTDGGQALGAYPEFRKLVLREGRYQVESRMVARWHRLSIGTIQGDQAVTVRMRNGRPLGTVEENYLAKLRPGDVFVFAGRSLELVRWREQVAIVQPAKSKAGGVPVWVGGRMPLSTELASALWRLLDGWRRGESSIRQLPEMAAVEPLLQLQERWSAVPWAEALLIETLKIRTAHYAFVFPFAGRLSHEGLAALVAYRIGQRRPASFTTTANDYGFSLQSNVPLDFTQADWRELLSVDHLLEDLLACLNAAELAKRQFREIARVAGLVVPGYPGVAKSTRQLQASTGLLFEVFTKYDCGNLLLEQARREILERQLEFARLQSTLQKVSGGSLLIQRPPRLTPLAFPLWADSLSSSQLSSEDLEIRIQRMISSLEEAAKNRRPPSSSFRRASSQVDVQR